MVLIFNEYHRNSRQAAQLYAERYPDRYQPIHNYFLQLENIIPTCGSFGSRGQRHLIQQTERGNEKLKFKCWLTFKLTLDYPYVVLRKES